MSRQATLSAPTTPQAQSSQGADGQVARSQHLDASLDKAHRLAISQHHGGVTSEHLLFALTEDPEALVVLGASTVSIERLRADITTHLGQLPNDTPGGSILPSPDLLKVLKLAAMAAQQSARRQIDGAIVMAAIIGDASTPSAGLLRAHGLTFNEVIRVLQKSTPSPAPSGKEAPAASVAAGLAPGAKEAVPAVAISQPAPAPLQTIPTTTPASKQAQPTTYAAKSEQPTPSVSDAGVGQSAPTPPAATRTETTVAMMPTARASTDEVLASVRARLQETAPPAPTRRAEKPAAAEPVVEAPAATRVAPSSPEKSEADAPKSAANAIAASTEPPPAIAQVAPPVAEPVRLASDAAAAASRALAAAGTPPPPVDTQTKSPPPRAASSERLEGPRTPADLALPMAGSIATPPPVKPATLQPPLPLVSESAQRSGPPPLPLPTLAAHVPAMPRIPSQSSAPQIAPIAPTPREAHRVPPIPPPTVDMRSLAAALPKRLRQGQTEIIEIIVPRRSLEIPPAAGHRWPPLRVVTMRLKVGNEDAHVELASPETLWISPPRVHQGADDATWRWRITPRNKGRVRLSLAGATRIVGSEGISGEIPLGEESVEIDVARRGSRRGLVGLLLFGNLLALGFLAMVMSGRAAEFGRALWIGIRGMIGLG